MKTISRLIMDGLKRGGAHDIVVSTQTKHAQQIKFSRNKINAVKIWDMSNLNVFMVKDKRLVTTNIRDMSEKSARSAVKSLLEFVKSAPKNPEYSGIAQGPFKYGQIRGFDQSIADQKEESIDIVEGAINTALSEGAKRSAGVLELSSSEISLITSNDVEANDKASRAYFSIRCFTDNDASGHSVCVSRQLNKLDIEPTVRKAASVSVQARSPKNINAGKYDVIFDHLPYANLVACIGSAASIFSVEAGLSCLTGKMNKGVGSKVFSLHDNAQLPNGFNSSRFDAEGVPTQINTIIDKGNLKTYLHNTSTASRHNTKTTANAGLVSPSAFNLVVDQGKLNKQEMISSIKKGIYITNVWYTRFQNYNTGDFSTIPRDGAFLIKNGKIAYPVKHIRLSDNLLNILKSTEQLGNTQKQVFGWEVETPVVTPIAHVKKVNITKSEK